MARIPKIRAPKADIQRIFNEHYLPLVMSGQLHEEITYNEPAGQAQNQPPGTRSIGAWYRDANGVKVAWAHYYWLPASPGLKWRIGGSGVPEGKTVFWNGVHLIPGDD